MTETLTAEEAFREIVEYYVRIQVISDRMEKIEKYSPFNSIAYTMRSEIDKLRKDLISRATAGFKAVYTPNMEVKVDFEKVMNKVVGELTFKDEIIENWFFAMANNTKLLDRLSLKQLLSKAKRLLPYRTLSEGKVTWKEIAQKNILELQSYSWRQGSSYERGSVDYYHVNFEGQLTALEKLIDVVCLSYTPGSAERFTTFLTDEVTKKIPDTFFGKHKVRHAVVEAYQFFKNSKLKIWFKRPEYAEAMALVLVEAAQKS